MDLKSVLLLVFLMTAVESLDSAHSEEGEQPILDQLAETEREIQRLLPRARRTGFKFSRFLENTVQWEAIESSKDEVRIIPSISIPHRDNLHHSMMLKKDGSFWTLRGELIQNNTEGRLLVCSVRNEQTYFARSHSNHSWTVGKLKIVNKKTAVQHERQLNLSQFDVDFQFFQVAQLANSKLYILGSKSGLLVMLDRNGQVQRIMKLQENIKQVEKVNNYLVVLTDKKLLHLNLLKNLTRSDCLIPYQPLLSFKFDDYNFRYIYARTTYSLLQYQLTPTCRPIRIFDILENADYHLAAQFIFVDAAPFRYAINTSDGEIRPFQLPIEECEGEGWMQITRRIQANYIVSMICGQSGFLRMTHVLLELEETEGDITDFSKFRIPLLFLSFGIIIYVTVRNKSKNKPQQEQEESLIEQNLMKKIAKIREQLGEQPQQEGSQKEGKPKKR